ncbi:S-adenosylmethionine:tRNA ribosyltransferase-isomerase [Patescibacteria group bacterium]|nr:S-adenosylmethionine:tRNA ribosyltransferase-isomerase [Patescibacteria group bacterium]
MLTKTFGYNLPKELIAQESIKPRDRSRLLVLKRASCHPELVSGSCWAKVSNKMLKQVQPDSFIHDHFYNIGKYLRKGDVVVLNDTKVIPARLITNQGKEIFLLKNLSKDDSKWFCLTRCKGRTLVSFSGSDLQGRIVDKNGQKVIYFNQRDRAFWSIIEKIGEVPTPPYIVRASRGESRTKNDNSSRFVLASARTHSNSNLRKLFQENKYYQTVFAQKKGSVAAPTAGFHFTQKLINRLKKRGVRFVFITLHIGLGTFMPIRAERIEDHQMHAEWFNLSKYTADILNRAKSDGRRIIAVGTTTTRVLESCAITPPYPTNKPNYYLKTQSGETKIFITPGYKFKFVDALITNFHLPHSTPLLLASAFIEDKCHCERLAGSAAISRRRDCFVAAAHRNDKKNAVSRNDSGIKILLEAYKQATKKKYRFYSFGDAMLIL